MTPQPTAVPLNMKESTRRAPSALSLVAQGTLSTVSSDDAEGGLLDFNEADVIAGIVPVPPTIPAGLRLALDQAMDHKFHGDTDLLNQWLHADHPALRGASPFETLVAGDGVGVLRALLWSGERTRGRRAGRTSVEHCQTVLRLER